MVALPETAEALAAQARPRNKVSFERGRRNRAVIRALMLDWAARHPLRWPMTAEQMRDALRRRGIYLSTKAVRWHMQCIREAAELEARPAGAVE